MFLYQVWKNVSKGWSRQVNDTFVIKQLFAWQHSNYASFHTWRRSVLRVFDGINFRVQVFLLTHAASPLKIIIGQKILNNNSCLEEILLGIYHKTRFLIWNFKVGPSIGILKWPRTAKILIKKSLSKSLKNDNLHVSPLQFRNEVTQVFHFFFQQVYRLRGNIIFKPYKIENYCT